MGVSKNWGTPKLSILIGVTIHFEVPIFLETPRWLATPMYWFIMAVLLSHLLGGAIAIDPFTVKFNWFLLPCLMS